MQATLVVSSRRPVRAKRGPDSAAARRPPAIQLFETVHRRLLAMRTTAAGEVGRLRRGDGGRARHRRFAGFLFLAAVFFFAGFFFLAMAFFFAGIFFFATAFF